MFLQPRASARRVVIIGAGAIGSHIAASLRAETPILIVDPCAKARSVFAANGYDTRCPTEDASQFACADPRRIGAGDVVVLATTASMAVEAVAHVSASVPVICLSNGLNPALQAARSDSLVHGVVEFAVHCTAPGVVTRPRDGWLTLPRDSMDDATAFLASAIVPLAQKVRLVNDIDPHRYSKLMLNASLDPVAAIIGGTIGDVFRLPEAFRAFRVLLRESLRVADAARWQLAAVQGIRPDVLATIFHAPLLGSIAARAAGRQAAEVVSTLARQVRRGEIGEAEYLSGAIIREGERHGVPTPAHARAMAVLHRIAFDGGGGGHPRFAVELLQR